MASRSHLPVCSGSPAGRIIGEANLQKFFASFFQKRSFPFTSRHTRKDGAMARFVEVDVYHNCCSHRILLNLDKIREVRFQEEGSVVAIGESNATRYVLELSWADAVRVFAGVESEMAPPDEVVPGDLMFPPSPSA